MAVYRFGAVGTTADREMRIEFEFEEDRLVSCTMDGVRMDGGLAADVFGLDRVYGPGYVPRGAPGSRLNALNFLRWDAFDSAPRIFGNPGEIDAGELIEGAVY